MGVDVPYDTDTKEYGNIIRDMVQSKTAEAYDEGYAKGAEEGGGIDPSWTDWQYFSSGNNRNSLVAKLKYNDTSNGTNFKYMFNNCSELLEIPRIDTSNGTTFAYMFSGCTNLTYIPELKTSKSESFASTFNMCNKLQSIPAIDTSNSTVFSSAFSRCDVITEIPDIDTSKGTAFSAMFFSCMRLVTIPKLNLSSMKNTNMSNMFASCGSLTNVTFEGVIPITMNVNWFNGCNKLTVDSLMSFINALTNTGTATYTVTIGSTNLAKLTDEQKAIATAKNIKLA
jgi:hypothetical protein